MAVNQTLVPKALWKTWRSIYRSNFDPPFVSQDTVLSPWVCFPQGFGPETLTPSHIWVRLKFGNPQPWGSFGFPKHFSGGRLFSEGLLARPLKQNAPSFLGQRSVSLPPHLPACCQCFIPQKPPAFQLARTGIGRNFLSGRLQVPAASTGCKHRLQKHRLQKHRLSFDKGSRHT